MLTIDDIIPYCERYETKPIKKTIKTHNFPLSYGEMAQFSACINIKVENFRNISEVCIVTGGNQVFFREDVKENFSRNYPSLWRVGMFFDLVSLCVDTTSPDFSYDITYTGVIFSSEDSHNMCTAQGVLHYAPDIVYDSNRILRPRRESPRIEEPPLDFPRESKKKCYKKQDCMIPVEDVLERFPLYDRNLLGIMFDFWDPKFPFEDSYFSWARA